MQPFLLLKRNCSTETIALNVPIRSFPRHAIDALIFGLYGIVKWWELMSPSATSHEYYILKWVMRYRRYLTLFWSSAIFFIGFCFPSSFLCPRTDWWAAAQSCPDLAYFKRSLWGIGPSTLRANVITFAGVVSHLVRSGNPHNWRAHRLLPYCRCSDQLIRFLGAIGFLCFT